MANNEIEAGPIKQYQLYQRVPGGEKWVELVPGAHRTVYDVPEVNQAVQLIRQNERIQALCVRLDNGNLVNIVVFEKPSLLPNAFIFHPAEEI